MSASWQHIYLEREEVDHDLEGLDCSCDPAIEVECPICSGDGCEACDRGWVDAIVPPAPDDNAIIIHQEIG